MTVTTENKFRTRYNQSVKEIRANGVKFRTNYTACCRGCASAEIAHKYNTDTYGFVYGGQGTKVYIQEDKVTNNTGVVNKVYIDYSTKQAGNIIKTAFENNGFTVSWSGDTAERIGVNVSVL